MNTTLVRPRLNPSCMAAWRTYMVENGYSPASIKAYMSAGKALLAYNEIDSHDGWVNRYFNVRKTTLSAASLQVHRAAARHLFKFLELDTPLENYRMPPVTRREAHPLPGGMDDVYSMLDAAWGNRNHVLIVAFCGLAGMRISEALACKATDMDLKTMQLTIKGKGSKVRYVPLSKKLLNTVGEYVVDQLAAKSAEPFVTLVETSARQAVTVVGAKAGIDRPVASHDLRMTFATHMYDQSGDIMLVQKLLGHESVETTQLYVGIEGRKMSAAVEAAFQEEEN